MFDDAPINNAAGAPPSNLPSEPVDMFSGVEKDGGQAVAPAMPNALDAGKLQRKETSVSTMPDLSGAPATAGQSTYEVKGPILGKIILFIVIAVILGGLGFGGWWVYMRYFVNPGSNTALPDTSSTNNTTVTNQTPSDQLPPEITATTEETASSNQLVDATTTMSTSTDISAEINNDKILFGEQIDSDRDGLDDAREKELGTDQYNSDTDSDGLSDYDEVVYWKTDPLKTDTDGDSYNDGKEARSGYNPLGPGKLPNNSVPSFTVSASSSI